MRGSRVSWEERYCHSFFATSRAFGLVRNSCAAAGLAGSCCQGEQESAAETRNRNPAKQGARGKFQRFQSWELREPQNLKCPAI